MPIENNNDIKDQWDASSDEDKKSSEPKGNLIFQCILYTLIVLSVKIYNLSKELPKEKVKKPPQPSTKTTAQPSTKTAAQPSTKTVQAKGPKKVESEEESEESESESESSEEESEEETESEEEMTKHKQQVLKRKAELAERRKVNCLLRSHSNFFFLNIKSLLT